MILWENNLQCKGICTIACYISTGDFAVTWLSKGDDGAGYGIYAQRYNAASAAQGSEFRVNDTTTNHQEFPGIAIDSSGNFVIGWDSLTSSSSATS